MFHIWLYSITNFCTFTFNNCWFLPKFITVIQLDDCLKSLYTNLLRVLLILVIKIHYNAEPYVFSIWYVLCENWANINLDMITFAPFTPRESRKVVNFFISFHFNYSKFRKDRPLKLEQKLNAAQ